jgi:Ca-activated chloride channel homolog
VRQLLRRRGTGRLGRQLSAARPDIRQATAAAVLALALVAPGPRALGAGTTQAPAEVPPALSVQITSPLGRTGVTGPVRIVARIVALPKAVLSTVQFFVDGALVGEDTDGPPYAVEWLDDNPFQSREITVQVGDSLGHAAHDTVHLKALELTESTSVNSVLLEPLVRDEEGRSVKGLSVADFHLLEDGVPQTLDQAIPDAVPATYTLLVDSSQSMSRRMDFVREAAGELPGYLRPADQVLVVPFAAKLGAITGPTKDRETITGAVDAIRASGGTAILDGLASVAQQLTAIEGRHVIVLITDGYDENSGMAFNKSLDEVKATGATVYVIGVGGVAGISLKGESLLRRLATETGGQAFFPFRSTQLADVHERIASDVQERYLITYTPGNQRRDGTWRAITLSTDDPKQKVEVRPGYFAPAPPPVRPQLELTIRDTNHEFVDVSLEDLVVTEDGVVQKVEGFEEALAPVSVVLVLDASGSMRNDAGQVMEAARSFVGALPDKDSLAVMQFADRPVLVQDLSTHRQASLEAIDQYQAGGGTALYDALIDSLRRLARVDGRRVVVVLTDGRDENNPGTAPGSIHTFDEVLKSVTDTGATVFSIGLGPKVDRAPLEKIAEVSAGEAYFPQDVGSLAAEYRRVLENLRRRYIITYTSTNFARDGAWRKVEITSRRGGVIIESKGGYFAPNDNK